MIQPPRIRRQGNASACGRSPVSKTANSRSRSNGALDIGSQSILWKCWCNSVGRLDPDQPISAAHPRRGAAASPRTSPSCRSRKRSAGDSLGQSIYFATPCHHARHLHVADQAIGVMQAARVQKRFRRCKLETLHRTNSMPAASNGPVMVGENHYRIIVGAQFHRMMPMHEE